MQAIHDGKIDNLRDLQQLLGDGKISKAAYPELREMVNDNNAGENQQFRQLEFDARERAHEWFEWEVPGPTPGTSIRNPRAKQMEMDFHKLFLSSADAWKKTNGTEEWLKFPFFDSKFLGEQLSKAYPERQRNEDQGKSGLSKPQAEAEDQTWATEAHHPRAPRGFDEQAWQGMVANPPLTPGGFAMPHAEWDLRLRVLAQDPSPAIRQLWDTRYGPDGTVVAGPSADEVLRGLRGTLHRPASKSEPTIELPQFEIQPGQPEPGMAVPP